MSGYPGLIGKWMSGVTMASIGLTEQRRAVGEVVGATNCDPTGWLALLVDGDIVHVSVSGARVEQHERLPPPPRSIPSAGVPR